MTHPTIEPNDPTLPLPRPTWQRVVAILVGCLMWVVGFVSPSIVLGMLAWQRYFPDGVPSDEMSQGLAGLVLVVPVFFGSFIGLGLGTLMGIGTKRLTEHLFDRFG